ncbi:MAG: hypothetical protein WC539_09290 [Nitrospirota bacterium]
MCIAFSPDGTRVATSTRENEVNIWDVASGEKIKALKGHLENVEQVTYSPDGKQIASGSTDGIVMLWNAQTGDVLKFPSGFSKRVCALAYVPNSSILMSADCIIFQADPLMKLSGEGCKIVFWDTKAAKPMKTVDSDCGLSSATFSLDGRFFVTSHAKHASGRSIITIYERKRNKQFSTQTSYKLKGGKDYARLFLLQICCSCCYHGHALGVRGPYERPLPGFADQYDAEGTYG